MTSILHITLSNQEQRSIERLAAFHNHSQAEEVMGLVREGLDARGLIDPWKEGRSFRKFHDLFLGLTILARYITDDPGSADITVEHDQLWAGGKSQSLMADEDRNRMLLAGWNWDDDIERWTIYF